MNLEQELDRLQEMRSIDSDEGVANALLRVGVAFLERGRIEEAFDPLDEAYYLCNKLENPAGLAQVGLRLAQVAEARSDYDRGRELLQEALGIFIDLGDQAGRLDVLERLAAMEVQAGRPEAAVELLKEGIALLAERDDRVGLILFTQYLAPLYRGLERWEEAEKAYRDLGRLADRAGDTQRVALALMGLGTVAAHTGRPAEALSAMEQAAEVFRGLGQNTLAEKVEQERAALVAAAGNVK